MKKLNLLSLATIIFFLLFSIACNKDDDNEPEQSKDTAEFEVKTVDVPDNMMQSNSPGAIHARSYINIMNGMSTYGGLMNPPKKSSFLKNGENETITWTVDDGTGQNNYNVTLKVTESPVYIKWELIYDGTIDGMYLNNFTYVKAEEYKDGSGSTITIYDFDNPESILMTMSWYESGGATYFTLEIPNEVKVEMVAFSDDSGSIEISEWVNGQYVLELKVVWDSSGHGEYWEYENGELIENDVF